MSWAIGCAIAIMTRMSGLGYRVTNELGYRLCNCDHGTVSQVIEAS